MYIYINICTFMLAPNEPKHVSICVPTYVVIGAPPVAPRGEPFVSLVCRHAYIYPPCWCPDESSTPGLLGPPGDPPEVPWGQPQDPLGTFWGPPSDHLGSPQPNSVCLAGNSQGPCWERPGVRQGPPWSRRDPPEASPSPPEKQKLHTKLSYLNS